MLPDIVNPGHRALVARVIDDFERIALPLWPTLRAQVIHGDLTVDNVLMDDDGFITGIVDFGDMSHTALIVDLSSVLDSAAVGRQGADELIRVARLLIDGFQRRVDLEDVELELLGLLWATRSALTIAISSWRVAKGLEEREFAERYNDACAETIQTLVDLEWGEVARLLGGVRRRGDATGTSTGLAERRSAVFGPTMEPLFYDEPIDLASADGAWITDTAGRTYLDAYNNVPVIGHGHPRVRTAIARQSRQVNSHLRYLHPSAIELAERLVSTCPPELDTVLFVNSGSEANDLAWRMATAVTGNTGGLCTDFAYHGITDAIAALSPETWFDNPPPAHVETWRPPDPYRGIHLDSAEMLAAIERLARRGVRPAAMILDGIVTSDRIARLDPHYVQAIVAAVRAAGGLWIADEVQSGHARTGENLWAFERFGVTPDFVTLGKPMGNGHPIAAVITRSEIVRELAGHTTLFSTFGGNPVSAAAGLAVLDVIDDERVLVRVRRASDALAEALSDAAAHHDGIGDVRNVGLAFGVELVSDPSAKAPDALRAKAVRDRMRHHGVLVGTTARAGNVLKIRPPLAFTSAHVSTLVNALDAAMRETLSTGNA